MTKPRSLRKDIASDRAQRRCKDDSEKQTDVPRRAAHSMRKQSVGSGSSMYNLTPPSEDSDDNGLACRRAARTEDARAREALAMEQQQCEALVREAQAAMGAFAPSLQLERQPFSCKSEEKDDDILDDWVLVES